MSTDMRASEYGRICQGEQDGRITAAISQYACLNILLEITTYIFRLARTLRGLTPFVLPKFNSTKMTRR